MRLLADMGISPLTVTALLSADHDVQHVADLGMARAPSVSLRLIRALAEHADALEHGALVTVTERAVRVRSLPIETR